EVAVELARGGVAAGDLEVVAALVVVARPQAVGVLPVGQRVAVVVQHVAAGVQVPLARHFEEAAVGRRSPTVVGLGAVRHEDVRPGPVHVGAVGDRGVGAVGDKDVGAGAVPVGAIAFVVGVRRAASDDRDERHGD